MFVDIKRRRKWSQGSLPGLCTKVQQCAGRQSWNIQQSIWGRAQISSVSPISKSSTNMETAARLPAEAPDTCRGKLRPAWGEADSPWLWRHEERKSWDSSPLRGGRGRGSRSQQRTSWACWELMLSQQTGCLGTVSLHQGACHHMWRGLWGLKIQSREMIPRISISDV